jgi:hypothetical protein
MKAKKVILRWTSAVLLVLLTMAGCSTAKLFDPPHVLPDDRRDISAPEYRGRREIYSSFDYSLDEQSASIFDFSFYIRAALGRPKQSLNVDAFGEVSDSSWFTNRNGLVPLSPEAAARGPATGSGPDIDSPLTIISARKVGMIPEFSIRDVKGDRFVLKFDPLGFNELCSGAEVIVSRIFYAAGYNVPENTVVYVDPDLLILDENCTLKDERGRLCRMTALELERLKEGIHLLPGGKARALAGKALPGKPLGPFLFAGTREDDSNDIVPHEHRRELRGIFPLCAWLKHFDIKNTNSQDMFVEENGCRYVRHYLVDFRTTLGADIMGPMPPYLGHEMILDINAIASNLMLLGLKVQSWESGGDVRFPSIGRFDDTNYEPGKARTNYYIPAFMNMTNLDGYWGAKLVMSFSDDQLAAIVREAGYSNEAAARSLLETLIARRDKTGRHWFSRSNPLDRFQFRRLPGKGWTFHFEDLGVLYGLWTGKNTRYRYDFSVNGKKVIQRANLAQGTALRLDKLDPYFEKGRHPQPVPNRAQREITLRLSRNLGQTWSKRVKMYYTHDPSTDRPVLVGVKREE